MAYIKVYERDIVNKRTYPSALAQSVHFALSFDGKEFTPLKNNYGILYPKAEIGELDNILERGAKNPCICFDGSVYCIFADYADASGNILYPEKCWMWTSPDLVSFKEIGLVEKKNHRALLDKASDTVSIPNCLIKNIIDKYGELHFTRAELPDSLTVNDISELNSVRALCHYSDGSTDQKNVIWNTENISGKGTFTVNGEIFQLEYPAPCIEGFADPVIFPWGGKKYFIATNDTTGNIGLYVSCADNVMGLFTNGNAPECILPYDEKRNLCSTFWAPEFHVIGGRVAILFAVGGKGEFSPQSHIMFLKNGGDIMNPGDWDDPIRIKRKNGEFLVTGKGQITLDMTYFEANGRHYYMWSQRSFEPVDSGSMLYIAEFDPKDAAKLTSDPVLISRPLYGWENQNGTVNNEGPYPLFIEDKIYIAYSAAAASGFSYSLGYLTAKLGDDLLQPSSWKKELTPALTSYDMTECEGPGHNAFSVGDDGSLMFVYHAQKPSQDGRRNSYLHRVHMDKNGYPRLDLIPERDLPKDKRYVSIKVNVN